MITPREFHSSFLVNGREIRVGAQLRTVGTVFIVDSFERRIHVPGMPDHRIAWSTHGERRVIYDADGIWLVRQGPTTGRHRSTGAIRPGPDELTDPLWSEES